MNDTILKKFKELIDTTDDEKNLFEKKNIFTKEHVSPLYLKLKEVSNEHKKEFGQEINKLKNQIEELFNNRINEIKASKLLKIKAEQNPLIKTDGIQIGGINPIEKVIADINYFFSMFNFEIVNGQEVIETKYNFDNLNIDLNHPARDKKDTFYINDKLLLRTHCTSVSAKKIENNKDGEIKMVSYGNVYRKDDDDATHSHQFNQVDIIWIKKGLNLSNLKWIVNEFLKFIFEKENLKTRYRLSYFPFTEPSFEVDMSCIRCNGKGCPTCKHTGWIEILGAGIFHKNVIEKAKLDKDMVGLACGMGIDRIAMLKYGISDIRLIYNNDFRLLEQFRGIK